MHFYSGPPMHLLSGVDTFGHTVDTRRLGMWLSRNKDRVVDGFKIVLVGVRGGFTHWQLLQVRQGSSV